MTLVEQIPEVAKPRETVEATPIPQNTPDTVLASPHTPDTAAPAEHRLYTYPAPDKHYESDLSHDIEKNPALYWNRADF